MPNGKIKTSETELISRRSTENIKPNGKIKN